MHAWARGLLVSFVVAVGPIVSSASAAVLPGEMRSVESDATSAFYDTKGKKVFSISGDEVHGWYDVTNECWVSKEHTETGVILYAGLTHSTLGGAVPVGRGRWKVWAGRRLGGMFVQRGQRRVDVYGRSGTKVGRALGRDALEAAAARLIWDVGGVPGCLGP